MTSSYQFRIQLRILEKVLRKQSEGAVILYYTSKTESLQTEIF